MLDTQLKFGRATRADRGDPLRGRRVVWLVETAGSPHELETRAELALHIYAEDIREQRAHA